MTCSAAPPDWLIAELCEACGKLHGGISCPAPVTGPPPGLFGSDDELTVLGMVVEDAANFLAMRCYLDPDADEYPAWVLAELAGIAREEPCGDPICRTIPDGFLHPSAVADHFLARRQEDWERWVPVWACNCGRTFKVTRESPGTAFYQAREDGLMGGNAGCVKVDVKGQKIKGSDACPGCGRLFADTIAGRPVTPRERDREAPAEPALTLF